ncbi:hypothetical protein NEF87_002942 [Candidatus Lokiarchaeum ossiferum]|uniref:Uncharacterized protein n=1 Tax=Candidatus Lokiarchaeum ossiferum TaxID=2951803 RepID=A0ABY6HWC5_9ARCH|nr:hypothetical protein NEF87_002942 [Candidatus Lokiarchaeum sp. B-35]
MTDKIKTKPIDEMPEDDLIFYDQGEFITHNILTTITKIVVITISIIYLISSKFILTSWFPHQYLLFIFTIGLACVFIAAIIYEIVRDVMLSRYIKLAEWDSVKFTPEGILLDVPVESERKMFTPAQIAKIELLTKVRWGDEMDKKTIVMIHALMYLKDQSPQMIYCLYREEGAPIPRSKLKQISKYISNHYGIPVKIRNIRDFSILMLLGILLISIIPFIFGF